MLCFASASFSTGFRSHVNPVCLHMFINCILACTIHALDSAAPGSPSAATSEAVMEGFMAAGTSLQWCFWLLFFRVVDDIWPRCCQVAVTYYLATKWTLWTWFQTWPHDMAHNSTQSAAYFFFNFVSWYWPIGVTFFYFKYNFKKSDQSRAPRIRVPCSLG